MQGAVDRLYRRGYVEPVRFDDHGRRMYALTGLGNEAVYALHIDPASETENDESFQ